MNFLEKIRAATAKAKQTAEADNAVAKAADLLPMIEEIAKAASDEVTALQTALTESNAQVAALVTANAQSAAAFESRIKAIEDARVTEASTAKATSDEALARMEAMKTELTGLIEAAKTSSTEAAKAEADTVAKAKIDAWVADFAPRGGKSQGRVDDVATAKGKEQPEGDKALTGAFAAIPAGN